MKKCFFWTVHAAGWGGSALWEIEIQDNPVENKKEDSMQGTAQPKEISKPHIRLLWPKLLQSTPAWASHSSSQQHQAVNLPPLLGSCWEHTTRIPEQNITWSPGSWWNSPLQAAGFKLCTQMKQLPFINGIKFILMLQEITGLLIPVP